MNQEYITKNFICIGLMVEIVTKENRATQKLTRGYIKEILTKGNKAKKITVKLTNGEEGVVKKIIKKDELKRENFKFYNLFFYNKEIYSIWSKKENKFIVINHLNKITNSYEKVAFLFDDYNLAEDTLKKINNNKYMVKLLSRNKPIVENFKKIDVDYFSINKNRKLSFLNLKKKEEYFKNI